jgi:sensitive to high expression protein 9
MDNLQSRALTATQKINDLTGYSAIESIKLHNTQLEHDHAAAQRRLRAARHDYKSLTAHRAATQREVTTLLTRKDMWNPSDLERFTTLYRLDHELETQVAAAAEELTEAETDEGRLSGALNAGILRRYHEEQIWSDRIRRQSTWGTWGLMGVNVVLFLVLQFVAEPWRRARLVKGIAEGERGVLEEVRAELGEVRAALEASGLREWGEKAVAAAAAAERAVEEEEETAAAAAAAAAASGEAPLAEEGEAAQDVLAPAQFEHECGPPRPWKEVVMEYWEDPELLKEAVLDLSSDRRVDLRMRDASLIALQGAAAGATVAAVLAISLLRFT